MSPQPLLPQVPKAFAKFVRCATLICSGAALAQGISPQGISPPSGGSYVLTKQVIAGGGTRSSGGAYVLIATLAQANVGASNGAAASGVYLVNSGFHNPAAGGVLPDALFRNGFE